jgi:predicted hotdog family 3-hydroxylacyl-ACP dehydratase
MESIRASELLPHRPPFVMIDRLVRGGDGTVRVEAALGDGHAGVSRGRVLESALVECVAQAAAALKAHAAARRDSGSAPASGLLVGVSGFRVARVPGAGDRLTIHVQEDNRLGPLTLVTGRILLGEDVIAEGQLKLYAGEPA